MASHLFFSYCPLFLSPDMDRLNVYFGCFALNCEIRPWGKMIWKSAQNQSAASSVHSKSKSYESEDDSHSDLKSNVPNILSVYSISWLRTFSTWPVYLKIHYYYSKDKLSVDHLFLKLKMSLLCPYFVTHIVYFPVHCKLVFKDCYCFLFLSYYFLRTHEMRKIKSFILYKLKLFQMFYMKLEETDMFFLSSIFFYPLVCLVLDSDIFVLKLILCWDLVFKTLISPKSIIKKEHFLTLTIST